VTGPLVPEISLFFAFSTGKNDLDSGLLLAKVPSDRIQQVAKTDPIKRALASIL
jgi:hypothetical protein